MIPFSTYESRYGLIFKTRCEYIPVRLVHPLSLRMTVLKINPHLHLHLDTE